MANVTPKRDVEALQAEVERLQKALASETEKRTAAEERAEKAASSQLGMQYADIVEVPTGKKIKVQRLEKMENVGFRDDGRPILRPKFVTMEEPTFFYKIDLPPSGGDGIRINGVPHFHGSTYEVTMDELRVLKDQVHRSWAHERSIRGDDENERSYRKPLGAVLRGGEGRRAQA